MSRRTTDGTAAHEHTASRTPVAASHKAEPQATEAAETADLATLTTPAKNRARHARAGRSRGPLRSWLQTGLAALAVSALGLGVAGSVILTGHATQNSNERPVVTVQKSAEPSAAVPSAFERRDDDSTSRDSTRKSLDDPAAPNTDQTRDGETLDSKALDAKVAERAERRSAELAKASGSASLASQKAAESARTKDLKAAQKSVKKNGDRLEAAAEAAAAAKAAEKKKQQEQAAASQADGSGGSDGSQTGSSDQTAPQQNATSDGGSDNGGSDNGGSGDSGTGKATLPIANYSVAARFGQVGAWARYHTGFDFAAPIGTPIRAADSGTVTNAGSGSASGWAGTYVTIKHSDGTSSLYAHMSSVAVSVGQQVSGGAHIGNVGVTGRSFGPHCHFEIYPAGVTPGDVYKAINPETWLQARGLNP